MKTNKITVTGILILVFALLLALGSVFVFHACTARMENGGFMACHWAQQAVFGAGIAMTVAGVIHLFAASADIRIGLDLALLPFEVFTALIPGVLIKLCMKNEMRCHTILQPSVIVIAVLMILATVADIFVQKKRR